MIFHIKLLVILITIFLATPANAFYTITDLGVMACSPSCNASINNKELLFWGIPPALLGALSTAVLAFVGLMISNIATHFSAMSKEEISHQNVLLREKDSLLREKAEALGEILMENGRWLVISLRSLCPNNTTFVDPIPPILKAVVILHLYFPELENELKDIFDQHTVIDKLIDDQKMILLNEPDIDNKVICYANYENSPEFKECGDLIVKYSDAIEVFLPKVAKLINEQTKKNKMA